MDNLPAPTPNRQWFRLASLARLEALGETSDPSTLSSTPTTLVQGSTVTSTPAAPQPQPAAANGAPPLQRIRVPSRSPTPPQSPKVIKASTPNPSDSPKVPQQLQPHPEPEPEMPLQPKLTSNTSNSVVTTDSSANGKKQESSIRSRIDAKEQTASSPVKEKKFTENNEYQTKVITMAGDNTGAYFELLPQRRGNSVTKGEQYKGQASKESGKEEAKPKRNVVNSNVQSVNNSILFGTSCTLRSPGVHVAFINRGKSKHKGVAE